MSLSYRVTFLCNGCSKLIIHQKVLYDTFFIKKLVKWCIDIMGYPAEPKGVPIDQIFRKGGKEKAWRQ